MHADKQVRPSPSPAAHPALTAPQEQNERMMRELTSLHTSMTAGAKRDARKKSTGGHNVNSAAPPAGMLPPPNMNPQLNMMHGLVGPGVGGHVHAQSMSAAAVKQEDVPARYGRGRPGTSAGYEGGEWPFSHCAHVSCFPVGHIPFVPALPC